MVPFRPPALAKGGVRSLQRYGSLERPGWLFEGEVVENSPLRSPGPFLLIKDLRHFPRLLPGGLPTCGCGVPDRPSGETIGALWLLK